MTTDEILEQAQVFASAWSLVGSRFDSGDAIDSANNEEERLGQMIDELVKERDEWKARCEFSFEQRDKLTAERDAAREAVISNCARVMTVTAERDEYIRCYNLLTQNAEKHLKELQIRQDCISFFTARARALASEILALQAERDTLKAELEIARMVPYVAAMSEIAKERDALKDAARLALGALVETRDNGLSWDAEYDKAIAALKAVL